MYHEMEIAGLTRKLPLFPVAEDVSIAAFNLFGDVEMTVAAAKALLEKAPEYDILFTAEAKSIPLIYEMARQAGDSDFIIARKGIKVYMEDPICAEVRSITTQHVQRLYLGQDEVERIRGRRVLIVDDVISTGESLKTMEKLVEMAGGVVAGRMAVLAEGDSLEDDSLIVLGQLPLFHADGSIRGD